MNPTIHFEGASIHINNIPLQEILKTVYDQGRRDAEHKPLTEKVTFTQLSKELAEKGRVVSVKTLTNKARAANVKIYTFDGKRLAVLRKDIKEFISI